MVSKELDRLVKAGILKPVKFSKWATPIVAVEKKGGGVRICADFSVTLNPHLNVDIYPLPRVEDIMATLAGGESFSVIDLANAYLQMDVENSSKQFLTITTHKGLFEYQRLPFGLASAPAIWQRTMDMLLNGYHMFNAIWTILSLLGKKGMNT